jgi:protein TonB
MAAPRNAPVFEQAASLDPKFYRWSFPGCPVVVHLDLAVVDRLCRHFTAPGNSPQGLLLGKIAGGATEVLDFDPVRGSRIEDAQASIQAVVEMSFEHKPVGYFRVTTEPDLSLSANDRLLAEACFNNPRHVFLLVRMQPAGPPTAAFFFWDSRGLAGDFPYLEFLLDSETLSSYEREKTTAELPAARAVGRSLQPAVQATPAQPAPSAPSAAPARPVGPAAPRRPLRVPWKLGGYLLVSVLVGYGALAFLPLIRAWISAISAPSAGSPPAASAPAPVAAMPAIGLHAQRQNGDLMLTWDRNAAPIARATSAVVRIHDGQAQRDIPMDATQVQSGSVLYSPVSDQIQIELTVYGPSSSLSESVLVILPAGGAPVVKPQPRPASPAPPPAAEPASVPLAQATKAFKAPEQRQPAAHTPAMDEAPALSTSAVPRAALSLPVTAPPIPTPQAPPLQPPAATLSAARPQPPAAQNAAPKLPISEYHAPEVATKMLPVFPSVLRSIVMRPVTVQVRVSINETGKVTKAEGIREKGIHGLLYMEAERAASAWKFKPAHEGDRPVRSEMVVSFTFQNSAANQ